MRFRTHLHDKNTIMGHMILYQLTIHGGISAFSIQPEHTHMTRIHFLLLIFETFYFNDTFKCDLKIVLMFSLNFWSFLRDMIDL